MGSLVLTRKPGDAITVSVMGEKIGQIMVGRVNGQQVQIVIDLPDHYTLMRNDAKSKAAKIVNRKKHY